MCILPIVLRCDSLISILFAFTQTEPVVVVVSEGEMANFTLVRTGPVDYIATVLYRFDYGGASSADVVPLSNDSLVVFDVGEWLKSISFMVEDDDIPETDEHVYIILFNATGM